MPRMLSSDGSAALRVELAFAMLPVLLILALTVPNLWGVYGLGAETTFDHFDRLYGNTQSPRPRPFNDASPELFDWPREKFLIEQVRQGNFPLWNPIVGNGMPLAPSAGGIFSPVRLLLYLGPFSPYSSFVAFRLAKLFIAALGAYLAGRALGQPRFAAAVASVVFGVCGGMLSQLPFASTLSCCWLPLLVWAQVKLGTSSRPRRWVPALALTVALIASGGHQTIVFATLVAAAVFSTVSALSSDSGSRRAKLMWTALAYLLGACLAAPALLTALELYLNGASYKFLPVATRFRDAAVALNYVSSFPGMFTPLLLDGMRDAGVGGSYPEMLNLSTGVTTVALFVVGLMRRPWNVPLLALLGFGIIVCFEPLGLSLSKVPVANAILARYLWPFIVLPIVLIASRGLVSLAEPEASGDKRVSVLGVFLLVGLGAATHRFLTPAAASQNSATLNFRGALDAAIESSPVATWASVALFSLALLVIGLAWLVRRSSYRQHWAALVGIVCIGEVLAIANPHLRGAPSPQLRGPVSADVTQLREHLEARHARAASVQPAITIGLGGWREPRLSAPMTPKRSAAFFKSSKQRHRLTVIGTTKPQSPLLDLAGVEAIIAPPSRARVFKNDPKMPLLSANPKFSVYENRAALPRARVVYSSQLAIDIEDAGKKLADAVRGAKHVDQTQLLNSAIIEPTDAGEAPAGLTRDLPYDTARFVVDNNHEVVIEVNAKADGYAILSDTHYPGWHAEVDGQPAPIFPANVGFRAVSVSPGIHQVRFYYRPWTLVVGFAATFMTLLACAGLLLAGRLQARPRPCSSDLSLVR